MIVEVVRLGELRERKTDAAAVSVPAVEKAYYVRREMAPRLLRSR